MQSSGMWNSVDDVRTDISEESIASNFRIEIFCEVGTVIILTSKLNHIAS
jgi:hypothetical protein